MALLPELSQILRESELTFEEVRAFETGLSMLTNKEQETFMEAIKDDPELIYPLYINFKAKLHAANGTEEEWDKAVETEIIQLEDFMTKRRVGNEIV
ncbi:MAG: hypothetical protein QG653_614 [Patescibacteria group bacterium]|nr:hypothetical protein [Patescibacteria group bacterium]